MAREIAFTFPLEHGLHARPAAALHEAAAGLRSSITFVNSRTGRSAPVASTLGLVATLTRRGDPCVLSAEGDDEEHAAATLSAFLAGPFLAADTVSPAPPAEAERPLPRALRGEATRAWRGTPVSGGTAFGTFAALETEAEAPPAAVPSSLSPERETEAFREAKGAVAAAIERSLSLAPDATARALLRAHLAIVGDVVFGGRVEAVIAAGGGAATAVTAVAAEFAATLSDSGDALLAERAADIDDLARRVRRALAGECGGTARDLPMDAIVAAGELSPSEFLALDRERLRGLVLERCGATSHVAILARAAGVPCVAGLPERRLATGTQAVIDGDRGLVVTQPSPSVRAFYRREAERRETRRARLRAVAARRGATADGRPVTVAANASSVEEVRLAVAEGADGIGLFRTEFMFLGRTTPPSEEEQTELLGEAVRSAAGMPVTIRTLDAGADKPLPCIPLPAEPNPSLGRRAIRIYEQFDELIGAHLRAILRASAAGPVRVMFPMVASVEEARAMRVLLAREQERLAECGTPFDPNVRLGVMIEVPSAALLVDRLAGEAAFFSVGSNDLLQYLFAADRGNPGVAGLSSPLHPAFLRLLARVVGDAHACGGRPVGVCGEAASDLGALPLLVGLGLEHLSVAPDRVAEIKGALADLDAGACAEAALATLDLDAASDVAAALGRASLRAAAPLASPAIVRARSDSASREAALRELVGLLDVDGRVSDADAVEDAVWAREDIASTAVGLSIAVPHCASPHVRSDSVAALRFVRPVDWGAADGEAVSLAVLIAVRPGSGTRHLRLIAALSRRLMDDECRQRLLGAVDDRELAAALDAALEEGER
ncbi:MAG: phosphoenolpyruvate--protein phosphotransferase [Acidobacteriota bacterium]